MNFLYSYMYMYIHVFSDTCSCMYKTRKYLQTYTCTHTRVSYRNLPLGDIVRSRIIMGVCGGMHTLLKTLAFGTCSCDDIKKCPDRDLHVYLHSGGREIPLSVKPCTHISNAHLGLINKPHVSAHGKFSREYVWIFYDPTGQAPVLLLVCWK